MFETCLSSRLDLASAGFQSGVVFRFGSWSRFWRPGVQPVQYLVIYGFGERDNCASTCSGDQKSMPIDRYRSTQSSKAIVCQEHALELRSYLRDPAASSLCLIARKLSRLHGCGHNTVLERQALANPQRILGDVSGDRQHVFAITTASRCDDSVRLLGHAQLRVGAPFRAPMRIASLGLRNAMACTFVTYRPALDAPCAVGLRALRLRVVLEAKPRRTVHQENTSIMVAQIGRVASTLIKQLCGRKVSGLDAVLIWCAVVMRYPNLCWH